MQTRTPGAKDQADIVFFIVGCKSAGIEAKPRDALGVRGNHSGPIRYTNVRCRNEIALALKGRGRRSSITAYHQSGAVWEGGPRRLERAAVAHTTSFVHKDRNKRLSEYQAIRQELGAAKVLVETLRPWCLDLAARLGDLWRAGKPQSEILIP